MNYNLSEGLNVYTNGDLNYVTYFYAAKLDTVLEGVLLFSELGNPIFAV